MTLGELRWLTKNYPDSMPVTITTHKGSEALTDIGRTMDGHGGILQVDLIGASVGPRTPTSQPPGIPTSD